MLLKYFYDAELAHASYLVGCQQAGEAIVIDPARDVSGYLHQAAKEGLKIVGAAETHIHADFVSGARELAEAVGATLYLSDEGPPPWQYALDDRTQQRLLKSGDRFSIGGIDFKVLHTPGHTPESISLLLTDRGGGADEPMGIFTGDFIFVGSIGRPDLLETAAGVVGSAEAGARQLYLSMRRFRELPEHLQVWPAHGAGSACGKGLGAIPSTTVGYEKRFNPALQFDEESSFVDYILADQPETPFYFAVMKRVNKVGPDLVADLPRPEQLTPARIAQLATQELVIDTRPIDAFALAHLPGAINLPTDKLVQWAGFFVDYQRPLFLVTDEVSLPGQLKRLGAIGIDRVAGFVDPTQLAESGLLGASYPSATPAELAEQIARGEVMLLDVRSANEYQQGHIADAQHQFLGHLMRQADEIDGSRPLVVQCLGGERSAIAASILQRDGHQVTNMRGGYRAWVKAGLPTVGAAAMTS